MAGIYLRRESYNIIGACLEVHGELGNGFYEIVYQDALEKEFELRKISYKREKELSISYKGLQLSRSFYVDFICYNNIIVELKAVESIIDCHISQVLNYLKASDCKLAILVNFGAKTLQYKRIIL